MISAKGVNFTLGMSLCFSSCSIFGIQSWGSNVDIYKMTSYIIQQGEQILYIHINGVRSQKSGCPWGRNGRKDMKWVLVMFSLLM